MSDPNGKNEHALIDGGDDLALEHAADAPTAVWDEAALEAAGVKVPEAAPGAPSGAAPAQIQTDDGEPEPLRRPTGGMSWPLTVALAVGLGTAVYFAVRLLR